MRQIVLVKLIIGVLLFSGQLGCCKKSMDRKPSVEISLAAVASFRRGNDFNQKQDYESAIQEYQNALKLQPKWQPPREALNYCLRTAYPLEWSKNNPADKGAWMTAFAQLLDKGAFDEAANHIDRLPKSVTNRQDFSRILEIRRARGQIRVRANQGHALK